MAECRPSPYVEQEDEGMPMSDTNASDTSTDAASTNEHEKRVVRNDEAGRYEIWVGDQLGGFSEFEIDDAGRAVFPHTEVDPAFKGQGLGGTLVGEALADATKRGEGIVPLCPFVKKYLRENEVAGAVIEWPEKPDARDAAAAGDSPA
jgi:uncharacterized protein